MALFNPRDLKKMLKRYGVEVEELQGVERAEFYVGSKRIVIISPQVIAFKVSGQVFYQVSGGEQREEAAPPQLAEEPTSISDEDVRFVMEQANVPYEKAKEALVKARGDIVKAIMILRGEAIS
ncbi:MAG: nascent polypeptide-associated complex protein [Desulfurococcaceae archaeon]